MNRNTDLSPMTVTAKELRDLRADIADLQRDRTELIAALEEIAQDNIFHYSDCDKAGPSFAFQACTCAAGKARATLARVRGERP